MSTLNVANLELQITRKIASTTNIRELAILNKALYVLQTGVIFTVPTFSNLPNPDNSLGKLYFVEQDTILYFSFISEYGSVSQWIPITNVSVNNLWTWGDNTLGRLGDGTQTPRCSPGTVAGGITTWCQVSSGNVSISAIKTDGTLWTWGRNTCGNLGNNSIVDRCSPGTVAGGGNTWSISCSGSTNASIAIKTDGTIWTWGCNACGNLGDGTTISRSSPGTVFGGGTNWCQVSTFARQSAAIKTDGTIWTWGFNQKGELGDGTTVIRCSPGTVWGSYTTWTQVSNGFAHMLAIKTDGTLWSWGQNSQGSLGHNSGLDRSSPGTVAGGGITWCQVSSGDSNSAAIKTDGTLWTWGCNHCGQLGDGTTVSRSSPGTVAGGGTTWCKVSNGTGSMSAIKTDGTLWTWGCNVCGVLGVVTIVSRCSPGTVAGGGTTWCNSSFGGNFMAAITKETL